MDMSSDKAIMQHAAAVTLPGNTSLTTLVPPPVQTGCPACHGPVYRTVVGDIPNSSSGAILLFCGHVLGTDRGIAAVTVGSSGVCPVCNFRSYHPECGHGAALRSLSLKSCLTPQPDGSTQLAKLIVNEVPRSLMELGAIPDQCAVCTAGSACLELARLFVERTSARTLNALGCSFAVRVDSDFLPGAASDRLFRCGQDGSSRTVEPVPGGPARAMGSRSVLAASDRVAGPIEIIKRRFLSCSPGFWQVESIRFRVVMLKDPSNLGIRVLRELGIPDQSGWGRL